MSLVYEPDEDSYLLSDVLKKEVPLLLDKKESLSVLEIGVGSGIQLTTLLNLGINKKNIFGTDLNAEAVDKCVSLGFNCVLSDLFSNVSKKFDLIIFNPPYLPEEKGEPEDSKLITTGGKKGSELINRFLKESKEYLNKEGKIFLLISSLTKGINFLNYKKKILGRKKIFFEELLVYEFALSTK